MVYTDISVYLQIHSHFYKRVCFATLSLRADFWLIQSSSVYGRHLNPFLHPVRADAAKRRSVLSGIYPASIYQNAFTAFYGASIPKSIFRQACVGFFLFDQKQFVISGTNSYLTPNLRLPGAKHEKKAGRYVAEK